MDFKKIITDLQQRGYTLERIGLDIGVTAPAVRALLNNRGQQPRWVTGDKLITMHKKAMRKHPKIDTVA